MSHCIGFPVQHITGCTQQLSWSVLWEQLVNPKSSSHFLLIALSIKKKYFWLPVSLSVGVKMCWNSPALFQSHANKQTTQTPLTQRYKYSFPLLLIGPAVVQNKAMIPVDQKWNGDMVYRGWNHKPSVCVCSNWERICEAGICLQRNWLRTWSERKPQSAET